MFFVVDHGESLGDDGVFFHGTADSYKNIPIAQKKVPFFIWVSDSFKNNKNNKKLDIFKKLKELDLSRTISHKYIYFIVY